MSDLQLSDLFAKGTAPESDPAFAGQVAARIGRARLGARLRPLVLRIAVVLMLSVGAFTAAGVVRPVVAQLVEGWPQLMGVPLPVALGALAVGLAFGVRAHGLRPDARVGLLEQIE